MNGQYKCHYLFKKILFSYDRCNIISILFTNFNTIFIKIIAFNFIIARTFWKYYFQIIQVKLFQYYLQILIPFLQILLHSILLLPEPFFSQKHVKYWFTYNIVNFKILWVKHYFQHCLKMVKAFFYKTTCGELIKNTTVVAYSKAFVFRRVEIGGKGNQYLQFTLNLVYKDDNDLKHATFLWNLVNWWSTKVIRCKDNAFFFNIMLGYNTVLYDFDTKHWYWDEVNSQTATCYIKFSEHHYDYI